MRKNILHSWDVNIQEARKIQEKLKKYIKLCPFNLQRFLVAGIDVSFKKKLNEVSAAIVLMEYPQLQIKEISIEKLPVTFPYVPGFLAFREAPVILKAYEKLRNKPDLLLFDGQGMAHPRLFGLACHVGVLLDKPSIGCGKKHLYGDFIEPAIDKGAYSYLSAPDDGERIGAVLRSRRNVSCIYVSPGHLMNVNSAIKTTFSLILRYRLPEPIRLAHTYAGKGWEQE